MQITFAPMRRDMPLLLEREGDVLIVNRERFDFSPLEEGAELRAEAIDSDWLCGPVRREGGALHLTMILPHGRDAPQETLFPAPLTVTADGPVALPPYQCEPQEEGGDHEQY